MVRTKKSPNPPSRASDHSEDQVQENDVFPAPQMALNRVRQAAQTHNKGTTSRSTNGLNSRARYRSRFQREVTETSARDPLELSRIMGNVVADRGWSTPVAVGSVIAQWSRLVGQDIARHCSPESFEGTQLHVRCDSTTWATQLRLLTHDLLARFSHELGPDVVTQIKVLGPVTPNWRKGLRTVSGRGPRDTYG